MAHLGIRIARGTVVDNTNGRPDSRREIITFNKADFKNTECEDDGIHLTQNKSIKGKGAFVNLVIIVRFHSK